MIQPEVIFLDAAGTLFGVRGGVGEVYARIALEFGVEVAADKLDIAFMRSFKAAPKMAFPDSDRSEINAREYQLWKAIATQTFTQAGTIEQFRDFEPFFRKLYDFFAGADPWFIYDDVLTALQYWQGKGIELGVISNFDSRIYAILQALDLTQFFDSITISTEAGAAKPDPAIFNYALGKHKCASSSAWHIGDSLTEDFHGATSAGVKGIWLNRHDGDRPTPTFQTTNCISNLREAIGDRR